MCWVIPPASPAATSVSRIASSSEVLPWSTWPMIVTTGGRSTRLSSASSNSGASGSSSAAVTISILRSYSSAIALIDSSVRVWVSVAISPIIISFLITSALPEAEQLGDLAHGRPGVDPGRLRLRRLLGSDRRLLEQRPAAPAAAPSRRPLRRRPAHLVAAGGLRIDHDTAFFRRSSGFFRRGAGFGGRFRRLLGGAAGLAAAFGSALVAVAPLPDERLQRIGLLDAGSRGFRLDPSLFQRSEQLFAAQPLSFGNLVDALLSH